MQKIRNSTRNKKEHFKNSEIPHAESKQKNYTLFVFIQEFLHHVSEIDHHGTRHSRIDSAQKSCWSKLRVVMTSDDKSSCCLGVKRSHNVSESFHPNWGRIVETMPFNGPAKILHVIDDKLSKNIILENIHTDTLYQKHCLIYLTFRSTNKSKILHKYSISKYMKKLYNG